MQRVKATIVEHERVQPAMWRMAFRWDARARGLRAARFLMLGFPGKTDPLLPRPFSISDVRDDGDGVVSEILYKPMGKATQLMTDLRVGDAVSVLGLLGNGFPDPAPGKRSVLLAGGIGNAPFAHHVRELLDGPFRERPSDVVLFLAGRTASEIWIQPWVRASGITIVETTDDGTRGEKGRITEALARRLPSLGAIEGFACGPTPMLRALKAMAVEHGFPCHLSTEELMACGYGVCNACVVEDASRPGTWIKSCHEGPVFECREIIP